MDPVSATVTIDRPREEVFDYLADVANHPEFCDHYLKDWHLTRIESVGRGAGARFKVDSPFNRFGWSDLNLVEVDRPYRIIGVGRGGKYNRIKTFSTWTLSPAPGGGTRVEFETESDPPKITDKLVETLSGQRGWMKRNAGKAMRRLQRILEENEDRGRRATIGGL